jgi:hypothetical protein
VAGLIKNHRRAVYQGMQPYGDHSRQHGVIAFEIGPESIDVEFTSGWVYRFTHDRPGALRVTRMKELALSGRGLSTFISKYVKNRYAEKWRREQHWNHMNP